MGWLNDLMILFESAMELATIIMLHFVFIMHHKVPKTKEKRERERERERSPFPFLVDHPLKFKLLVLLSIVELCIRTAKQQWTACNQTIYLKNWCHVIVATIVLRTISRAVKWFKKQPVTMSRRRPSSLANYSWNVCKDARKTGKFTRKLLERLNLWMWTKKSVFFLSFHGITTANPIYI